MKLVIGRAVIVCAVVFGPVNVGRAQEDGQAAGKWPELAPVSVDLLGASLGEVSEALSKAMGVPFAAGRGSLPAAFTVSAKERPFWDVFVELSKQNTLVLRPSMGGIELNVQGAAVPLAVSGPVLLVAEVAKAEDWAGALTGLEPGARGSGPRVFVPGGASVIPRYTGRGLGGEPAPPEGAQFVVRLAAIGDPRLITTRTTLERAEVLDDTGKPMKVLEVRTAPTTPGATTGPWQPHPDDYQRLNFSTWRITVAGEEGGGKEVASVKGMVKLRVSTKDATVRLDDVENKHAGEAYELGNATFTLSQVSLTASRLSFRYSAEVHGDEGDVGAARGAPARGGIAPLRIELLNAAGQPLISTAVTGRATNFNLLLDSSPRRSSVFPITPPFSLVLRASEKMEEADVLFEVKVGGDK